MLRTKFIVQLGGKNVCTLSKIFLTSSSGTTFARETSYPNLLNSFLKAGFIVTQSILKNEKVLVVLTQNLRKTLLEEIFYKYYKKDNYSIYIYFRLKKFWLNINYLF